MEQLIQDIQDRLTGTVPALQYVDIDWGQLDFFSQHPPVKWPCALIEFKGAGWKPLLNYVQEGLITVKVRLADLRFLNSSSAAPASQKAVALSLFGLMRDVHASLHGWAGHREYSKLIRTATDLIKREDGVRIYELTFTTELTDTSATPVKGTHVVTPRVVVESPL